MGYGAITARRNLTFALILPVLLACQAPLGAKPITVVALGDSLTAGYGLPEGEGLVPKLQAWLQAKGADVVVENAGVSGDTTAGGLSRLDWALEGAPDALIVTLGGNDMLRGVPVAEVRRNLDKILTGAEARKLPVLLVGMKAPLNWGPEYKRDFDAIYPELAAQYGAALVDNFFQGLLASGANPADPASMAKYMQADGIHPNPAGLVPIIEGLGPEVLALINRVEKK